MIRVGAYLKSIAGWVLLDNIAAQVVCGGLVVIVYLSVLGQLILKPINHVNALLQM